MPAPGVSRIVENQEFSSGRGWPPPPGAGQFRCRVASFLSARLHAVALALDGIVVVDLTQNVAGPFCTQILGDMGAEVVKVERPARGDDARAWAPPYWGNESATFLAMNRNKKSLALDLKVDGGLEVLRRLIARADVFVQSLRAGALGELGLDFAGAARINPRLVYCSITAFGARGHGDDRALPGLPHGGRLRDGRRRIGRALPPARRSARRAAARGRRALHGQPLARPAPRGARRGAVGDHARAQDRRPPRAPPGRRRPERADPHGGRRAGGAADALERHARLGAAPARRRLPEPRAPDPLERSPSR